MLTKIIYYDYPQALRLILYNKGERGQGISGTQVINCGIAWCFPSNVLTVSGQLQ